MAAFIDTRTQHGVEYFVGMVASKGKSILKHYNQPCKVNDGFTAMILVDCCFLLELFLRYHEYDKWEEKDPLMLKPYIGDGVRFDIQLLDNQIPFSFLEKIYNAAVAKPAISFIGLCCNYFEVDHQDLRDKKPLHFLDLLRHSILLPSDRQGKITSEHVASSLYSVSELDAARVDFQINQEHKFLDVKFENGVLSLPVFNVEDSTKAIWRNLLVFEQSHYKSAAYVTRHMWFLNLLIKTNRDLQILIKKGIIVVATDTYDEVFIMLKHLGRHFSALKMKSSYLSVCDQLNGFYEDPSNRNKAILRNEYLSDPWKKVQTCSSIITAASNLVQTSCTILQTIWQARG